MKLEFWATICLGHGDGGDVAVKVVASDEQYELLKAIVIQIYHCAAGSLLKKTDTVITRNKHLIEENPANP